MISGVSGIDVKVQLRSTLPIYSRLVPREPQKVFNLGIRLFLKLGVLFVGVLVVRAD